MGKKTPLSEYLRQSKYFSGGIPVHPIIETHFPLDMIKEKNDSFVVNDFQSQGIEKQ